MYRGGVANLFLKNRNGLWYLNFLICVDVLKEKLIACYMNMIIASSFSNASNDHELLGADQE